VAETPSCSGRASACFPYGERVAAHVLQSPLGCFIASNSQMYFGYFAICHFCHLPLLPSATFAICHFTRVFNFDSIIVYFGECALFNQFV